jgi:type IV pilus assembly protein PilQ
MHVMQIITALLIWSVIAHGNTTVLAQESKSGPEQLFAGETSKQEIPNAVEQVMESAEEIDKGGEDFDEKDLEPGNVTLDFKNADINNVLRIISLKSGVNIVTSQEVQGPVTIRLVNVPWEKALEVVLKTYGYTYERDKNIIRVTTLSGLADEELQTEVYPLNFARADEIQATLQEVLSERGSIRADVRTNVLIVTDVPTNLYKIENIIERIDIITPQVLIEARIVEMTLGDTDKMGIKWNLQAEFKGPARPTSFPWDITRPTQFERFFPLGEGSLTTTTVGAGGATVQDTSSSFPTVTTPNGAPFSTFPFGQTGDYSFGTLDLTEFQILMQVIQTRSNSKVLSEPRITVLNNQEASILVGEILAVPVFERNDTTGKMEVTGYDEKELGIQLVVTPQINSTNQIDVTLNPAITSLLGFDELTADIKAPRFATREASTKVRVRNGETIVVGGLIKEEVIDSKNKVPILGDIPLLDYIFSHRERTVNKTDLLFFITVTIVEEPRLTTEVTERG